MWCDRFLAFFGQILAGKDHRVLLTKTDERQNTYKHRFSRDSHQNFQGICFLCFSSSPQDNGQKITHKQLFDPCRVPGQSLQICLCLVVFFLSPILWLLWHGSKKTKLQMKIWAGKKQTKLFVAENGPFGTPFLDPNIPPKKLMWVPFWRPFPGNEAHKPFFFWGPKIDCFGWGPKSLCWKCLCAFSVSGKKIHWNIHFTGLSRVLGGFCLCAFFAL